MTLKDKLLAAKLPQLLGTYLAVGFGLLQFVEFVTKRYAFSAGWVDRYLLLWLGLLPAVALLLYYRGLPHKGRTRRAGWKSGLILVNLAAVLGSLFFVATPGEAATQIVSVTNEAGETSQRIIPSPNTVRRIAIFPFIDEAAGQDQDWWGVAYAYLLESHLRQRPEVLTRGAGTVNYYYDRFGVEEYAPVNLATQRKIAERIRTDYFVRATYEIGEDGHLVNGGLYRTRDGKEMKSLTVGAPDIYTAVDRLRGQIDAELPTIGDLEEQMTDLPSASLITDKVEALEAYTKGTVYFDRFPGDLPPAKAYFLRSLRLDPNCANCAYWLGDKLYGLGKVDSSLQMLRLATRLADVLPEREQFGFKTKLFTVTRQFDNTARVFEQQRTLYPYEFYPYSSLVGYYKTNYGIDSAIHLMQTAAEISDREAALNRLYSLQLEKEDYPAAEAILDELQNDFPNPDLAGIRRAELYRRSGRAAEARKLLVETMALDPLNPDPRSKLIDLELSTGRAREAERLVREGLRQAVSVSDSTTLWSKLVLSLADQGRVRKAREELAAYEQYTVQSAPVNVILMGNFSLKAWYAALLGEQDKIATLTAELAAYDAERTELVACYLPLQRLVTGVLFGDERDMIADCAEQFTSGGESLAAYYRLAKFLAEEDYPGAADFLNEKVDQGIDLGGKEVLGRVNRLAGNFDRAEKVLREALQTAPESPNLHLELALLLRDQGKMAEARTELQRPLVAWSEADPEYRLGIRALELAAVLPE